MPRNRVLNEWDIPLTPTPSPRSTNTTALSEVEQAAINQLASRARPSRISIYTPAESGQRLSPFDLGTVRTTDFNSREQYDRVPFECTSQKIQLNLFPAYDGVVFSISSRRSTNRKVVLNILPTGKGCVLRRQALRSDQNTHGLHLVFSRTRGEIVVKELKE